MWSSNHAVRYEPRPRSLCSCSAEMLFLWRATGKIAQNHVRSGSLLRWRAVPAVADA